MTIRSSWRTILWEFKEKMAILGQRAAVAELSFWNERGCGFIVKKSILDLSKAANRNQLGGSDPYVCIALACQHSSAGIMWFPSLSLLTCSAHTALVPWEVLTGLWSQEGTWGKMSKSLYPQQLCQYYSSQCARPPGDRPSLPVRLFESWLMATMATFFF